MNLPAKNCNRSGPTARYIYERAPGVFFLFVLVKVIRERRQQPLAVTTLGELSEKKRKRIALLRAAFGRN